MYLNEKPFAILNLYDTRKEQEFEFEPIGESEREDMEELKLSHGGQSNLKFWKCIRVKNMTILQSQKFILMALMYTK